MKIFRILLVFLSVFLFSCSKDNEPETPPTEPEVVASPDVVNINWDEAQLSEYDETSGKMTISFNGNAPKFEEGKSLIIVGTENVTAIRRIMKVTDNSDNNVTVETTQATMADLFPGQNFTLSFSGEENNTTTDVTRSANGHYIPVEVEVMTDNGFKTIYDAINPSRAISEENGYNIINSNQTFFKKEIDYSGKKLIPSVEWSPVMEKCILDYGLYGSFHFYFDTIDKEIVPGLKIKTGDLLACDYILNGKAKFDFLLKSELGSDISDNIDKTLLEELIPQLRFKFIAGGVPIFIILDTSLEAELEVNATGNIAATTGIYCSADIKAGVSWVKDQKFKYQEQTTPPFKFTTYNPTVTSEGSIGVKGSIYPQFRISFYDFLGVNCSFKPYLSTEAKAGARGEIGGAENYISASLNLSSGVDFTAEANLEFLGLPIKEQNLGTYNVFSKDILSAPSKIEIKEKGMKFESGKPVKIHFNVYDTNITWDSGFSPSSIGFVRFSTTNGTLDKYFGWPVNGVIELTWTPSSKGDVLLGELINADGEVISSDNIIHPKDSDDDLVGYWKMVKSYIRDFNEHGTLIDEKLDLTGETGDFFDLKFETNGIYYDIDPYGEEEPGKGRYSYDRKTKTLILDTDQKEEFQSIFKVGTLTQDSLIMEMDELSYDKEGNFELHFKDRRYFTRVQEEE